MKRMWAALAVLIAAGMLIAGCSSPENKNPTAKMTVNKHIMFIGGTLEVNASESKDSDGKIKDYTWNFGDGTPAVTTKDKGLTHTFSAAGAYNVTLQARDDLNGKSKVVYEMVVVAPLPTVSSNVTDTLTNLTFSVDTSALGGLVTDYSWSFGDGTAAVKGDSVEHAYMDNGMFNATLTLTYQDSISTKLGITVNNRAPKANITIGPTVPYYSNKPVTFNGASSGDDDGTVTNWTWDFGDNSTDNGTTVTHSYVKPGTYSVKLTVIDNDGATGLTTFSLEIVKDLVITEVTIGNYKDNNSIDRANVTVKFDNKGDAKVAGSINLTVKAYQSDKTTFIEEKSKATSGLVDSNSESNTMSVKELLVSNISPDTTQYWVELSYMGNVIDSGWYEKQ